MECWRLALRAARTRTRLQPSSHLAATSRHYASEGVRPRTYKRWSEAEDDMLIRLKKAGNTLEEISEALPDRSIPSVKIRLYTTLKAKTGALIAHKSPFSVEEIARVTDLHSQGLTWDAIALHFPKRSVNSLRWALRRKQNHDHIDGHRSPYSPTEIATMLHCRRDLRLSWPEIYPRLPDRTPESIRSTYSALVPRAARGTVDSVYYLSRRELSKLVRLRDSGMTWDEVAEQLGNRNKGNLRWRYRDEKIVGNKVSSPRRRWTKEADRKLIYLSQADGQWQDRAMVELGKNRAAVVARWKFLKTQRTRGLLNESDNERPDDAG